jgi:hypothetical protein
MKKIEATTQADWSGQEDLGADERQWVWSPFIGVCTGSDKMARHGVA